MLYLIFGFILGAGTLVFALQNTAIVTLSFLGWQFESSLALVIIIAAAAGVLMGILSALPSIIGSSFHIRALKKDNKALAAHADALQQHANAIDSQMRSSATVVETVEVRG